MWTVVGFGCRNRVMPTIAQRMAAADPLDRQHAAGHCTVFPDGLQRILRARRGKAATTVCAEQKDLCRRKGVAIELNQTQQNS